MASILDLAKYHEDLAELFFRHQKALLDGKVPAARAALQTYRKALARHILDEEELLMPVYKAKARITPGGDVRLFKGDHVNLLKSVDEYDARMAGLDASKPDWPRQLLALLDEETRHKHILDHHDQRERSLFFPALDQALPENERAELLARCTLRAEGM